MMPLQDRQEAWLEWRRGGVGGSDAAAVVGLDPWRSPVTTWLEKRGLFMGQAESDLMRMGKLLEPPIADEVERMRDVWIRGRQSCLVHPEHAFMRCTADGFVYEDAELGEPIALYEGKCTSQIRYALDWSEEGPPPWVNLQVQHNLAVTGCEVAWVSIFHDLRLEIREVPRNDWIIGQLIEIERDFWDHVVSGVPPAEVDSSERTREAIREAYAEPEPQSSVELPESALELLARRREAKRMISTGEAEVREVENRLGLLLGNAEAGHVDGVEVVRWPVVETRRLNQAALKANYAGLVERFSEVHRSRRWFVPKQED